MTPSPAAAKDPGDAARSLAARIEFAVLSVLIHYHGEVETSLDNWYLSLRLAFPDMQNPNHVRKSFKELWSTGIIALKSPWIGNYDASSGDNDLSFLTLDRFTVALTTRGVVRWDEIRRRPAAVRTEACMAACVSEEADTAYCCLRS